MQKKDQQILEIFMKYLNRRRSRRQKELFIKYFAEQSAGLIHEQRNTRISIVKVNVEIFGDIKKAKRVILAGYETGEKRLPGSETYHPFNSALNRKNDFNNLVLRTISSVVVLILAAYTFSKSLDSYGTQKILLLILSLAIAFLSFQMSRGFSSKGNVSKSVSLFTASQVAKREEDVAVILCDMMAFSKLGFIALEQIVPEIKNKQLIYLDCLGEGNQLAIGYRRASKTEARKLAQRYSLPVILVDIDQTEDSRFDLFENILVIDFVDEDSEGVCVPNAQKSSDRNVDLTMLNELIQAMSGGNFS